MISILPLYCILKLLLQKVPLIIKLLSKKLTFEALLRPSQASAKFKTVPTRI